MFETATVDAVVVGAGPVGLMTALRLAQLGASVRVLERAPHPNLESYALALHPATLELLEKAHLVDALLEHGTPLHRLAVHDLGAPCASVNLGAFAPHFPFVLVLPQSELERTLLHALRKTGVAVEWNTEVLELTENDGVVEVSVAPLTESPQGYAVSDFARIRGKAAHIRARHVVGADGFGSTVRRILGIPLRHYGPLRHFTVFEMETETVLKNELYVNFTPDGTDVLWPMSRRRCRWTFETGHLIPDVPTRRELETLVKLREPWFAPVPDQILWADRVAFASAHAVQFGRGPVWLVGDAAHQTLPFGVQSMNAGLQEADMLADALLRGAPGIDRADMMQYYEDCRLEEWTWLLSNGRPGNAPEGCDQWLDSHWRDLRAAIPASGAQLRQLAEQTAAHLEIQARAK